MTVPMRQPSRSDDALSVSATPPGAPEVALLAVIATTISDGAFRVYASLVLLPEQPYATEPGVAAMTGMAPARARHFLDECIRAGLLRRRQRVIAGRIRSTYEVAA